MREVKKSNNGVLRGQLSILPPVQRHFVADSGWPLPRYGLWCRHHQSRQHGCRAAVYVVQTPVSDCAVVACLANHFVVEYCVGGSDWFCLPGWLTAWKAHLPAE